MGPATVLFRAWGAPSGCGAGAGEGIKLHNPATLAGTAAPANPPLPSVTIASTAGDVRVQGSRQFLSVHLSDFTECIEIPLEIAEAVASEIARQAGMLRLELQSGALTAPADQAPPFRVECASCRHAQAAAGERPACATCRATSEATSWEPRP